MNTHGRIIGIIVGLVLGLSVSVIGQSWTTPATWTAGQLVTPSQLNTHLRDNLTVLRAGGIAMTSQAANDLVYASSSTQFARIAGAASSVLVTSAGSVPSLSTTLPSVTIPTLTLTTLTCTGCVGTTQAAALDGADITTGTLGATVQGNITTVGTITSGVWNAGAVTSSGAISSTAATTHAFQASANTANRLNLWNANTGASAVVMFSVYAGAGGGDAALSAYPASYVTSGPAVAGKATLVIDNFSSSGGTFTWYPDGTNSRMSLSGAGLLTVSGTGLDTAGASFTIKATTSDASDTSTLLLAGGGAANGTRGASLALAGNEAASSAGVAILGAGASATIDFYIGATKFMTLGNTGGLQMGAPTGGDKGSGTINTAADIYKNNSAYGNPDFVFEHFYTGAITKFATNEGAKDYRGLMPLTDLEAFVRTHYRFPLIPDAPMGAFKRSDVALALTEENTLYLFQHERRIAELEQEVRELRARQ